MQDVFLAGIPHLLFVLDGVFGNLVQEHSDLDSSISTALLGLFLLSSAGVAVYAWRRGWPLWTASWYSYAFWLLVVAIAYLVYWLGIDNWVLNSVIALGSIAAIALGYLFLFRISHLHALLVALFLLPVAAQFGLESIPNGWEMFIGLFFGLLAALASAYAVWSSIWPKGVKGALFANLLAAVALTYICFYQVEIPGFYGEGILAVFQFFAVYLAAALALFLGPWIFWRGWDVVQGKLR